MHGSVSMPALPIFAISKYGNTKSCKTWASEDSNAVSTALTLSSSHFKIYQTCRFNINERNFYREVLSET